jgi:hypothetical protein
MRRHYLLALAVSALALAGCKTDDEFSSIGNTDLCGTSCPSPTTPDTDVKNGDTTIALEDGKLVSPAGGGESKITITGGQAKYEIDTKGDSAGSWPTDQTLSENTSASGGDGLGAAEYREYADQDTQLQVWGFRHSYAAQYRDLSGGLGSHQAYSFGGTKTTTMPTSVSATFNGRYGSTAKADNFVVPTSDTAEVINPNGVFASNGRSQIDVNFGSGGVSGRLTPEQWRWRGDDGAWNYYDVPTETLYKPGATLTGNQVLRPYHFDTDITFNGNVSGNTFRGSTQIEGFSSSPSSSPVYGAFFGPGAEETTGVFHVEGTVYDPTGSHFPAADNGKGTLQHSGVFNGTR